MQVGPRGGPPRLSRTGRYGSPGTRGAGKHDWSPRRLRPRPGAPTARRRSPAPGPAPSGH
eukprot:13462601-Alexandrium_andersonii.AAC.1